MRACMKEGCDDVINDADVSVLNLSSFLSFLLLLLLSLSSLFAFAISARSEPGHGRGDEG